MDAINQPLLDVRDLSVAFGNTLAVDRVSFSVKRGECVALVGESGSGKSVSALSILKLLPYPSASHPSGQIRFRGRDLLTAAESEMREIRGNDISIIFQEPMTSLNPLHTIEKQIGEILLLHQGLTGMPARARIIELLSQGKANVQAPWLGFTGFFSVAIMLSLLIFIGEAARDAFDPRKTFR